MEESSKTIPEVNIIDGIAYYQEPYHVDYLQHSFEHLDCNSIILSETADQDVVDVVCYATSAEYNSKLYDVYAERYKGKGYLILGHISALEVNSID